MLRYVMGITVMAREYNNVSRDWKFEQLANRILIFRICVNILLSLRIQLLHKSIAFIKLNVANCRELGSRVVACWSCSTCNFDARKRNPRSSVTCHVWPLLVLSILTSGYVGVKTVESCCSLHKE